MEYRMSFEFKKAIVVNEEMLRAIEKEIRNYCDRIEYNAKLENDAKIKFDSLEELITYENSKGDKIERLDIESRKSGYDSVDRVDISIFADVSLFSKFESTATVSLTTDSLDKKTLLKEKLEHIFTRFEQDKRYNKVSRNAISHRIDLYFFICIIVLIWQVVSTGFSDANEGLVIAVMTLGILEFIKTPIEKKQKEFYPPIVFYLGDEKNLYDDNKTGRKSFFWTVVIGGTLTIVVGIAGIIVSLI